MSNPPMQWGYPRTVEGFIHAFTRGQYEKANLTDIIGDPGRFITQLGMLERGRRGVQLGLRFPRWCRSSSSETAPARARMARRRMPFISASACFCHPVESTARSRRAGAGPRVSPLLTRAWRCWSAMA
jgi:hypothetical protein